MSAVPVSGVLYHCPVCGAELVVLANSAGWFEPVCCNVPMLPLRRRAVFHVCPVCGAEVVMVGPHTGDFSPRCCNRDMVRRTA